MQDQGAAGCIFCRIARGEIPAQLVYEGADVVAFRDLNPQGPTHVLVIPRRHPPSLHEAGGDTALLGLLLLAAREVAERGGLGTNGYRVVVNNGPDGGQTVPHLHLHVLGGRPFRLAARLKHRRTTGDPATRRRAVDAAPASFYTWCDFKGRPERRKPPSTTEP